MNQKRLDYRFRIWVCVHCIFNDRAEIGQHTNGTTQGIRGANNDNEQEVAASIKTTICIANGHLSTTAALSLHHTDDHRLRSTRRLRSAVSRTNSLHPTHSRMATTRHRVVLTMVKVQLSSSWVIISSSLHSEFTMSSMRCRLSWFKIDSDDWSELRKKIAELWPSWVRHGVTS